MNRKLHPAVFLDRDGTIVEDNGYIDNELDLVFFENSFKALNILQEKFLLFIVTNQSGIGKGLISKYKVDKVNQYLVDCLKAQGIAIYDIYCCPHTKEDNCWCRKPEPYFLYKAAKEYNLDLSKSFVIGDHPEDVYCAENAGATGIYVLSGHGIRHLLEFKKRPILAEDILQAANMIINK
ncbi:D-glycero-alpha-D-manno-heptose-1,7-bisphosphate 7-phosphatase [Bacteroidota bacterium]